MFGEPRQVGQLLWIGAQVEQLRRVVQVVKVLVAGVAEHVGGVPRAHRMVLAEHRPVAIGGSRDPPQRRPRQVAVLLRRPGADGLENGREEIDQRDRRAHHLAHGDVGTGEDHRHRGHLLEVGKFAVQAARAQRLAVVGGVDDAGVVRKPQHRQRVEDPADLPVEVATGRQVGRLDLAGGHFVERLIEVEKASEVVEGRVVRPRLRPALRGLWQVRSQITIEPFGRPDVGRMGAHQGQEQHPGGVVPGVLG